MDNEKRLFVTEQEHVNKKGREAEAAKEVQKERETKEFEDMGKVATRKSPTGKVFIREEILIFFSGDQRESSLKFMYFQPPPAANSSSGAKSSGCSFFPHFSLVHALSVNLHIDALRPVFHDTCEDDDAVKAFKKSLKKHHQSSSAAEQRTERSRDASSRDDGERLCSAQRDDDENSKLRTAKIKNDPNFSASAVQSKLERDLGRKHNPGLSQEGRKSYHALYLHAEYDTFNNVNIRVEQEERFPFLKDAPTEGSYAKNVKVENTTPRLSIMIRL